MSAYLRVRQRTRCCVAPRTAGGAPPLRAVISLDFALKLDRQRLPLAISRFADGYPHPAFADAVFLNVMSFFVVKANADIMRKNFGMMMRAARIGGKMVRQWRSGDRVGHAGNFLSRRPLVSQKSPGQQNCSRPLAGVIGGSVGSVNALTHQSLLALTRRIQR